MVHQTMRNGPAASARQAKRRGYRGGQLLRCRPRHTGHAPGAARRLRRARQHETGDPEPGRLDRPRDHRRGLHGGRPGRPGLWLADAFQARPGIVMMATALVGLVVAGIGIAFLLRSLPGASRTSAARRKSWIATSPGSRPRWSIAGVDNPGPPMTGVTPTRGSPRSGRRGPRGSCRWGLLAADLVGVELALAVEVLPGLFEFDAGDRLPGGGTRASGTSSKDTAFLVIPGAGRRHRSRHQTRTRLRQGRR